MQLKLKNDKQTIIYNFNKLLLVTVALLAFFITLGIFAVFVYFNYRAGILSVPPNIKDVVRLIICLCMLIFFLSGSSGWLLLIGMFLEDRKSENNADI